MQATLSKEITKVVVEVVDNCQVRSKMSIDLILI